jgi:hypothetical protein
VAVDAGLVAGLGCFGVLAFWRGVEPMRCLAGLQCWRSRFAGLLYGARPGQVAAQLGLRPQTCSPSPCLQQGADLTLPARLRRQQGAPPGTASALVTPLEACRRCGAGACHQQGEKGLGRHLAGRLVGAGGAEQGSGHAQHASWSDSTELFDRSGRQGAQGVLRRHFLVSTARQSREAGPPTMKPGRMPAQPAPCVAKTKRTNTNQQNARFCRLIADS